MAPLLGIALTGALGGCQIQRPYGYYRIWADRSTYGEPALCVERVRTDDIAVQEVMISPLSSDGVLDAMPSAASTESSASEPAANPRVANGSWLFAR